MWNPGHQGVQVLAELPMAVERPRVFFFVEATAVSNKVIWWTLLIGGLSPVSREQHLFFCVVDPVEISSFDVERVSKGAVAEQLLNVEASAQTECWL